MIETAAIEDATDNMDFDDEMDAYACHLLKEAQKEGVKLDEKIKVFAAVQPYHAAREKYKGRVPGVPGARASSASFKDFKAGMKDQQ